MFFIFLWSDAESVLVNAKANNILHINTDTSILQAYIIAERYSFSFNDSLIISAALECDCTTLYSEDMNSGQIINGKLKIANPFK